MDQTLGDGHDTTRNDESTHRAFQRHPSDRTYAALHWVFMGLIAAVLCYGFVFARYIDTPRAVGFRLIILLILLFNALWWTIADRRFARHVRSSRRSRALRLAVLVFCIVLNAPILLMLLDGRPLSLVQTPTWYAAAVTFWHLCLVAAMPIVALLRLAGLTILYTLRRLRFRINRGRDSVAESGCCARPDDGRSVMPPRFVNDDSHDPARRAFLRTAFATVPMAAVVGATVASQRQQQHLQVNRYALDAPWLPARLRGLTITHICDLHVGRLYRPSMLPRLVDAANELDSDLVVVTGDIVDNSNDMLPPAIDALTQISHRHGLFACIGNHDQIDSRADFIRYVRKHMPLLINQRRVIEIGGEKLTLAGLDYPFARHRASAASSSKVSRLQETSRQQTVASAPRGRRGIPSGSQRVNDDHKEVTPPTARAPYAEDGKTLDEENIALALAGHDIRRDGPVIALAHHPHTWDALAAANVPLTLAGHTHGGQLMLTAPGERPDIGVGRLLFRYTRGFYRRADTTLFVNSGVGNWFPLRLRAPTEIVQIRLV
ncbi:MAG: metallophosphoesterase [Planctomycetota bacterium]